MATTKISETGSDPAMKCIQARLLHGPTKNIACSHELNVVQSS